MLRQLANIFFIAMNSLHQLLLQTQLFRNSFGRNHFQFATIFSEYSDQAVSEELSLKQKLMKAIHGNEEDIRELAQHIIQNLSELETAILESSKENNIERGQMNIIAHKKNIFNTCDIF